MSWDAIIGHDEIVGRLRAALSGGRLHPALLFVGPEGTGKRLVAVTLARALHCPQARDRRGDPCGVCRTCTAIAASATAEMAEDGQSAHPGIRLVSPSRPDEREIRFGGPSARGEVRSQIAVSQIRLVLAEGVVRGMGASPRVVVIDPADRLGDNAANALLKALEEPPASERFVLITARPSAVLPTIRSRCVRFRFGLLRDADIREALERATGSASGGKKAESRVRDESAGSRRSASPRTGRAMPPGDFDLVVSLAGGRIGRALDLAGGPALAALRETRAHLLASLEGLASGSTQPGTFVVEAGAPFRTLERDGWIEAIGVLETLLRDLALLGAGGRGGLVNSDIADRLGPLAASLAPHAARALETLDQVRSDLRINVNARLAAERILIEVAR